jgi:hypothetical protein
MSDWIGVMDCLIYVWLDCATMLMDFFLKWEACSGGNNRFVSHLVLCADCVFALRTVWLRTCIANEGFIRKLRKNSK